MKHTTILAAVTLLSFAAFVSSCDKTPENNKQEEPLSLTVEASANENIAATGGAATISVKSNGQWTVTSSQAWAKPSPEGGSNNGTVTVTCEENTTTEARTATITIVAKAEGKTAVEKTVSISQAPKAKDPEPEPEPEPTPEPDPEPGKAPVADLLDWVVNDDKTAKDVSAAGKTIVFEDGTYTALSKAGDKVTIQKNAKTGLNDAYFSPVSKKGADVTASTTSHAGYYFAKYEDDAAYMAKLADGHSIECYFCTDFDRTADGTTDKEIKPFSSMQSGGTGFVLSKISHASGKGHFAFITYTDGGDAAAFRWTECGFDLVRGQWYHAVGVYDNASQKLYLYMDGELVSTADAPGNYVQPAEKAGYWMIGGDPSNNDALTCTAAFKGNVGIARVYDSVLTAAEVKLLYEKVK